MSILIKLFCFIDATKYNYLIPIILENCPLISARNTLGKCIFIKNYNSEKFHSAFTEYFQSPLDTNIFKYVRIFVYTETFYI